MAKLMIAVAPKPEHKTAETYISRTWLAGQPAPTVDPSNFAGSKAKAFKIVSGNGREHTILYIEGVSPDAKL